MAIDLDQLENGYHTGTSDTMLERLAQRLGGHANAQAVFGAPVERAGVTIIPVAKVRYGFGGGAGTNPGKEGGAATGSGSGGGGGAIASPLGYIEVRDGQATFHRITDPGALIMLAPVILAGGIAAGMVLKAVRKLVRG